jgi:hypothetical protein
MSIPWFRCLYLALALGASAAPSGYRGDGSGRFADATLPTGWDSAAVLYIT